MWPFAIYDLVIKSKVEVMSEEEEEGVRRPGGGRHPSPESSRVSVSHQAHTVSGYSDLRTNFD